MKNKKIYQPNATQKILTKNAGFTIIEMLLVIGVLVVVIAFVVGIAGNPMTKVKTNSLIGELSTFQTNIHEVYNGQQNGYAGISSAELINSKAYPGSLNATATTLTSSSSGLVTVSSDDGGGTTFSIQYAAVPTGVCIGAVAKMASVGGWTEIDVGGSPVWSGNDTTPKKAAIDAACGAKSTVAMKFISN